MAGRVAAIDESRYWRKVATPSTRNSSRKTKKLKLAETMHAANSSRNAITFRKQVVAIGVPGQNLHHRDEEDQMNRRWNESVGNEKIIDRVEADVGERERGDDDGGQTRNAEARLPSARGR